MREGDGFKALNRCHTKSKHAESVKAPVCHSLWHESDCHECFKK